MANRDDILDDRRDLYPKGDEEVAMIVDGTGEDGQAKWGIDDLRPEIKRTIGDYLGLLSQEANSAYRIDPGSSEISLSDSEGFPAGIVTGGTNSDIFAKLLEGWVSNYLDSLSDTVKVKDYLTKGRSAPDGESGHDLLTSLEVPDVVGDGKITNTATDGSSLLEKQISQVLRANRFNPTPGETPFVENGNITTPSIILRDTIGVYDPDAGTVIDYDTLAKHALSLMLIATGDDDGSSDPDTIGGLNPSGVQIGTNRLARGQLSVREGFALNNVNRPSLPSDITEGGDDRYKSYGQINSFVEPFDGFLPIGMVSLAALLTTTTIISAEIIFSLLALIVNTDGKSVRMDPGPYIMGQYGKPEADGLISTLIGPRALGLVHTENDFFDAARRGANIFFGFTGDDLASAAETALLNIVQSPGYYVVTIRNILRSLNTISVALGDIDFSNPVQGAQAVLGMVDIIKSSKIIAFFNVSATLGDIVLSQELRGFASVPGEKSVVSYVDALDDRIVESDSLPQGFTQKPGMSVMKNRSKTGTSALSLAWRSSAAPAMYLLPKSILNAGTDFNANVKTVSALASNYHADKFRFLSEGNRLSSEDVREIEDGLEAEYVPFYFHDVRTNEIISFHAFLNSLNESYTPNYESSDGYGRIDPVRVYRNTERSIDLSFYVAATSEEDFDEMWWKVNKLITLVYPQWSDGRLVKNDSAGTSFTQPFSQIPTASPMIRMRIGDLIKTNYSKFNLARLFGMGTETFKPTATFQGADASNIQDALSKARDLVRTITTDPDIDGNPDDEGSAGFPSGGRAILRATRGGYYMEATPAGNILQQATSVVSGGSARRKVRLSSDVPVSIVSRKSKQLDRTKLNFRNASKVTYTVQLDSTTEIPGITDASPEPITELEVTHADLKIDPEWVAEEVGLFSAITGDASADVSDFFSSENNTIVRAFDSSKGRGLAGVITSLSFEWISDNITWETNTPGKKAPKIATVSMNFAPIHDIAPGIDSSGFNRAPVYNVGDMINKAFGDAYDVSDREQIEDLINTWQRWLTRIMSETQG